MKRCLQCDEKDATTLWGIRTRRTVVASVAGALAIGLILPVVLWYVEGIKATKSYGLSALLFLLVVFAGTQYVIQRAVLHYPHAANEGRLVLLTIAKSILIFAAGYLVVFLPLAQWSGR